LKNDLIIAINDLKSGIFEYKILYKLCRSEITRRYKRTFLGPLWISISLGMFSIIISVVWSKLWGQNFREYLPYLLAGMIPWTYFATSIAEACQAFPAGASLMLNREYAYTRQIYIILGRNSIILMHNLLVYFIVALFCQINLGFNTLALIVGFLALLVNTFWVALVVAIYALKYRDMAPIITILLQIAMFVTPIMWPVSVLNEKNYFLVDYNPLYHWINISKAALLGETFNINSLFIGIVTSIIGILLAIYIYSLNRKKLTYWF